MRLSSDCRFAPSIPPDGDPSPQPSVNCAEPSGGLHPAVRDEAFFRLDLSAHPSVDVVGRPRERTVTGSRDLPPLLTPDEVAALLRTTRRGIYSMTERGLVPGVVRIGRRLLFRTDDLTRWLGLSSEESSCR